MNPLEKSSDKFPVQVEKSDEASVQISGKESLPSLELPASKSHKIGLDTLSVTPSVTPPSVTPPSVTPPSSTASSTKETFVSSGVQRFKQGDNPPVKIAIAKELTKISKEQGNSEKADHIQKILVKTSKERMPRVELYKAVELYDRFKMSPPRSFSEIGEEESVVILWRGCRPDQLVRMVEHESAGGILSNPQTKAPSTDQAKKQVGELTSLPEFTDLPDIARQFGKGSVIAAFAIPTRYLTKGSVSEGGWVCEKAAPVALIAWQEGPPLAKKTRHLGTTGGRATSSIHAKLIKP